jgi:hypothetical protein
MSEGEWSILNAGRFTLSKEPPVPIEQEVVCSQKMVWVQRRKVKSSPVQENEAQTSGFYFYFGFLSKAKKGGCLMEVVECVHDLESEEEFNCHSAGELRSLHIHTLSSVFTN